MNTPKPSPSPQPIKQDQEETSKKHKHTHKTHKDIPPTGDPTQKKPDVQMQMQLPAFRSILKEPKYTFDDFGGYESQKKVFFIFIFFLEYCILVF